MSPWYQKRWGNRFSLRVDQNTKSQFDTTLGGSRGTTTVGGSLLGMGGDIILVDDPHNLDSPESDAERESTKTWWSEIRSTRLNNPKKSAIVVIMQRLHEEDVSGLIQSGDDYGDWQHLMVPMRHDERRHCVTVLKHDEQGEPEETFEDPRTQDGELMWPERFGEKEVAALERDLGPYMASGRLQQKPVAKGAAIFDRDWWQVWDAADGKFPLLEYVVASLDSAFTKDQENDPSGFTVWGCFRNDENRRRIILLHAWRKHLQFSGPRIEMEPGENPATYRRRTMKTWGLMEWVTDTCRRFKVDKLLIESKASGISAAQELLNRYAHEDWAIQLCPVKGDKLARALAVQATFAQQIVFAPERDWAEEVITEMELFPKGRWDDLTDSTTQAIKYLRDVGLANTDDETQRQEIAAVTHKPRQKPLYPV